jgi:hypothetical protein
LGTSKFMRLTVVPVRSQAAGSTGGVFSSLVGVAVKNLFICRQHQEKPHPENFRKF